MFINFRNIIFGNIWYFWIINKFISNNFKTRIWESIELPNSNLGEVKLYIEKKLVLHGFQQYYFMFSDDNFDMADTTKFYCTELVWRAYLSAGIDISKGRRHNINVLGLRKTSLLPSDITMGNTIKSINLE